MTIAEWVEKYGITATHSGQHVTLAMAGKSKTYTQRSSADPAELDDADDDVSTLIFTDLIDMDRQACRKWLGADCYAELTACTEPE
jgi:hypothetical protein